MSSAALSEATSGVRATKIFLSSHFRTSIWSVPTDIVAITFRFEPVIKTIHIKDIQGDASQQAYDTKTAS